MRYTTMGRCSTIAGCQDAARGRRLTQRRYQEHGKWEHEGVTPGGRQLRGWAHDGAARRPRRAYVRGGPQPAREPENSTKTDGAFPPRAGRSVPLRTDNMARVYRHLRTPVKARNHARTPLGRPKNVRNGVVMWKKRPAVPVTLFVVWGLPLPDAVSLQVFPLVVTRRCPRRCGRAAAIGCGGSSPPLGCGRCRSHWASGSRQRGAGAARSGRVAAPPRCAASGMVAARAQLCVLTCNEPACRNQLASPCRAWGPARQRPDGRVPVASSALRERSGRRHTA